MLRKSAWIGTVVLFLTGWLLADSKARIVRVSYTEGTVEMDRGDGHGFIRTFVNMPIIEGTRIAPRDDGRAEIEFEDGGTLRLVPNTIIVFDELSLGDRGQKVTHISLEQGTVYADLKDHDHDQFTLGVGPQELRLKHSSRFRVEKDQQQMEVAVFRGELQLQRPTGQLIAVKKNETLALDVNDQDRYYLSKGIVEAPHDYWDRERQEQIVADAARRSAPSSAVVYGYDDLSPYGQWVTVANYGSIWRPFGVSVGWSPYSYGSWVWYPSFGYTWVSAYPWGWTPYRYGGWYYVNTYGWCWRPGPRVHITNINIINAPPRYIPPRPPVVTHGHPFAIVADVNNRAVDPRSNWAPQARVPANTAGPEPRLGDNAGLVSPRRDNKMSSFASPDRDTPIARVQGTPAATADSFRDRVRVDHAGRVRTEDGDYNSVTYRRAAPAAPTVSTPVAGRNQPATIDRSDLAGRNAPVYKRDIIDRDDTTIRPSGREVSPSPEVSRPPARSEVSHPQVDRPASPPRMERPAPQPQVDRAPRMSAPRSSPPPMRSAPPAPMRSAPPAPSVRSAPMGGGRSPSPRGGVRDR